MLLVEIATASYVAMMVWLVSVWMVDDSVAARMGPMDWYVEAGRRLLIGGLAGAVVGGLTHVVNGRLVVRAFPTSTLSRRIPEILAIGIALTGVSGAIHFAITKPFM